MIRVCKILGTMSTRDTHNLDQAKGASFIQNTTFLGERRTWLPKSNVTEI